MTGSKREGTVYLTVLPGRYPYELRFAKATNKRPTSTPEGSVVVRIRVIIPRSAFEPLRPDATIEVPEEMVSRNAEISVEAEDADS